MGKSHQNNITFIHNFPSRNDHTLLLNCTSRRIQITFLAFFFGWRQETPHPKKTMICSDHPNIIHLILIIPKQWWVFSMSQWQNYYISLQIYVVSKAWPFWLYFYSSLYHVISTSILLTTKNGGISSCLTKTPVKQCDRPWLVGGFNPSAKY